MSKYVQNFSPTIRFSKKSTFLMGDLQDGKSPCHSPREPND